MIKFLGGVGIIALLTGSAHADVNLWIDDTEGNIGLVDITTGTVTKVNNTGQILTDIAFVGNQMFGTTFTGLFKIDDNTGAATSVASWNLGINTANALVGNGSGLLGASAGDANVFSATTAGVASNFKSSPLTSAGDLAFNGGTLYESGVNRDEFDALVNINTGTIIGDFSDGTPAGRLGNVFGLATDSTGTTYAVAGTEIYSVNLSNAIITPVLNYAGHGLGAANGTAFISENTPATPEPSTWAMMILGFFGLAFAGMRRTRRILA